MVYDKIESGQDAIDQIVAIYFQDDPKAATAPRGNRLYSGKWQKPTAHSIPLFPDYPSVGRGCRNVSMLSLAGQLHTLGCNPFEIFRELKYANSVACDPPLSENELQSVVKSVSKYRRE